MGCELYGGLTVVCVAYRLCVCVCCRPCMCVLGHVGGLCGRELWIVWGVVCVCVVYDCVLWVVSLRWIDSCMCVS